MGFSGDAQHKAPGHAPGALSIGLYSSAAQRRGRRPEATVNAIRPPPRGGGGHRIGGQRLCRWPSKAIARRGAVSGNFQKPFPRVPSSQTRQGAVFRDGGGGHRLCLWPDAKGLGGSLTTAPGGLGGGQNHHRGRWPWRRPEASAKRHHATQGQSEAIGVAGAEASTLGAEAECNGLRPRLWPPGGAVAETGAVAESGGLTRSP